MEEDNKENTRNEWEVLKEVARQFPDLGNGNLTKAKLFRQAKAERYNRRVRICNGIALLFVLAYIIIKNTSLYNNSTVVTGLDIVQGFAVGMLLVGLLYSSRYGARIRAFKQMES